MQKRLTRFIVFIVLILSGIYLMQRIHLLPSFSTIFKSKPAEIDNTVILVKEINNLAQLITISAYNEIAIDSIKKGWALFNNPLVPTLLNIPYIKQPDQKLILIGKGKILAGVNLAKLTATDAFVKNDSVSVTLPQAEILQVILNPSGFEVFEESGNWTDAEVKAVKIKLREKLIANATQQNILQKASLRAVAMMENFLRSAGFKKVTVASRS
jgi:Protein of unknown function (DUF4230)